MNNRVIAWPRGKQLGGSSAINLQLWNRASKRDIDNWGELGNRGWTWDDLLPYFKKVENFNPPSAKTAQDLQITGLQDRWHGHNGPIQVSYAETYDDFRKAWNPTFDGLGLQLKGDPFDGASLGGFTTPFSLDAKNVTRSYAATAYYNPNKGRPNLHVLTNAAVTKINFQPRNRDRRRDDDGEKKGKLTATGVTFKLNGQGSYQVWARREVILSSGVVQSPQLLEVSGIGGGKLLRSLGIDVLVDNAGVGENLQDHVHTSVGFQVADGQVTLASLADPAVFGAALQQFLANRTGILADAASSASFLSYEQLLRSSGTSSRLPTGSDAFEPLPADVKRVPGLRKQYDLISRQLHDANQAIAEQIFLAAGFNYKDGDNATRIFQAPPGNWLTMYGFNLHPFSRGSIHVSSADAAVYPTIDPRYLSNPIDLQILSTIALQTQKLARSQPFASLLKDNGNVFETGYEFLTPANVESHVRKTLTSIYHGIGTCSMLPRDDGGVVDSDLRVYGTSNLRVVDGSIAPLLTRGTIQSFVYAIAEKAADIIKESNRDRDS